MAEPKILKETELDGEKLEAGDIIEVSPRRRAKLALERVARLAFLLELHESFGR